MWPFASSLRSELFRPFPNNVIAKNLIPILSRDFSTTPQMSRNSWKYSLKRKIGHYKEVAGMFFVPVFRGEHFIDKELNRRYLIDGLSSRNWYGSYIIYITYVPSYIPILAFDFRKNNFDWAPFRL